MTEVQMVAGLVAAVIGVLGYVPYLMGIVQGAVRPNPVSWMIWALLGVVSLAGQIDGRAGLAAAVTAVTTAGCALITVLGLKGTSLRSSWSALSRTDRACLAGALVALALLVTLRDPATAVILSNAVGVIGFIPTVGKVLQDPRGEGISVYAAAAVKFLLAIVAVQEWSVTTWLYPALCSVEEIAMVTIILIARHRTSGKPRESVLSDELHKTLRGCSQGMAKP
ncbi:preprotein translocase subunit Sss1 [Arthrobacter sp. GAS37]|uniref:hypothetical protein n=1 Tax=Arthrobacter sp. GAS37 TaxID=3156261 RepID=UPI003837B596